MSKYTTEVRFICETCADLSASTGGKKVDEIIQLSLPKIFDFNFPIFDENYREVLETKILKHYYTREIAFETVGLWKLKLNTMLNEIMPYYNKLYESETFKFNPLYDVNVTREHTRDVNGTESDNGSVIEDTQAISNGESSVNTSSTNNHKDLFSETPQGPLSNVENGEYLTSARIITDTGNVNSTGTTKDETSGNRNTKTNNSKNIINTEDYVETVKGKQGAGSYTDMLVKYRDSLINIDMMIINELSDLFFNLW